MKFVVVCFPVGPWPSGSTNNAAVTWPKFWALNPWPKPTAYTKGLKPASRFRRTYNPHQEDLPDHLNLVAADLRIPRQDRHIFQLTLGDQKPIKRILMNVGQSINLKRVTQFDWQCGESMQTQAFGHVLIRRTW